MVINTPMIEAQNRKLSVDLILPQHNQAKYESGRMELSDPLATAYCLKRAEQLQACLSAKYPSFLKLMLRSHVSGCFCLSLPRKFCAEHLPVSDTALVLVDEAGKESYTKFLAAKVGLSAGWRGFSIDHGLLEGDVLVFQLVSPTKFQIYIVRRQASGEGNGSSETGQQISEENNCNSSDNYLYQSNSSDNIESGPEVLKGIQFLDSDIEFEGVKGIEDFHIIVDGLMIDSKFSAITRIKYYDLCSTQNSFLHQNFLKGLNCNLVVGIIAETINISDAIKSSCKNASACHEDLRVWEKTLKGFEMLGMKVDFLVDHINQLKAIAVESDTPDESNKLKESIIKRVLAEERMNLLENAEIKMSSPWKQEARIKEITAT